ncbi:Ig-like domain-containing protein [Pelomonas sp. KK5]|uniref:Ig-like domain-containing protein n=1 Tax=Pelomonas sp. KK5 TaxID=1855730 RepID=UPI00117F2AF9|nr:Ig-like domain-containing protein [Pelomonas sp. KK5]
MKQMKRDGGSAAGFVMGKPGTVLAIALLLGGCGGGGGSGSAPDEPAPTSASSRPLAMTATTASASAAVGMTYATVAMGLGQQALDWTAEAEAAAGLSITSPCPGGGSRSLVLADRDGNRRASPGDQLSVTLNNCYLPALQDAYSGTLNLDVTTAATTSARAGTLKFGAGFGPLASDGQIRIMGALALEGSSDRLGQSLHITSASESFAIRFTTAASAGASAQQQTEILTRLDATRQVRRDTARTSLTLAYHLSSELLGGSVDISTSTPWQAFFGSFPDTGEVQIVGASGSPAVQVRPPASNGYGTFQVLLGGAAVEPVSIEDASTSYLWSGAPWLPIDPASTSPTPLQAASAIGFVNLSRPSTSGLQPTPGELAWQYSRPLAPDTLHTAVLRKTAGRAGVNWAPTDIPATLRIDGALLSITPNSQLEPGSTYQIIFDNSFTRIADTDGHIADNPSLSVSVAQTVTANASLGAPGLLLGGSASLTLDASASSAATGSVSAQWRQVSGPALTITGADTLKPVITAAQAANGTAVVELTVRNAIGDIDKQTLSLPVLADANGSALALSVRQDTQPASLHTNVDAGTFSSYTRYFASSNTLDAVLSTERGLWRLLAQLPSLQAGNEYAYGGAAGQNATVVWIDSTASCSAPSAQGHLRVLDIAQAADGTLTRLAIDFEQTCGSPATTYGSIRYNSSLPLRP